MFGLFGGKSEATALQRHAERVGKKRAQAVDRWDSIQALSKLRSGAAAGALMARFTFQVDPSITDQEEKDAAFEGVLAAGADAIPPICQFLERAESISWPVKMLDRLATPEFVVGTLISLLEAMDTEYERDPQRKIQILANLAERNDPGIETAVTRFVRDANETVRFHAGGALLAQTPPTDDARLALQAALLAEESVRVRTRILDGFIANGWAFDEPTGVQLRPLLPTGYLLDGKSTVRKRT